VAFRRIGYRKIPTMRVINGNYQEGMRYIGQAMKQLMQLENSMRFQKLKQLSSTFKDENVVIECWHGFGRSQVTITTRGGVDRPGKVCRECMCGCHVSLGFVAFTEPAECFDHILDRDFTYDVIVCQKENRYIDLINCQPTDFTRFADGEKVFILWVPAGGEEYADNMRGGCLMETSSWGRILPFIPAVGKFTEFPC